MKQKSLTLRIAFLKEFFGFCLTRKFQKPLSQGNREGSSILPFIGWRHDRIDTRLNEVRKLEISWEAENPRFVSMRVVYT